MKLDLCGQRFERLTVLSEALSPKEGYRYWHCRCDCGVEKVVKQDNLRSGNTRSCGCLAQESRSDVHRRHGRAGTIEYRTWLKMWERCRNPRARGYENYGARGITVDPRWSTFEQFFTDMGERPDGRHSIERRDNNGPYSPENCYWATKRTQANNTRRNLFVTFNGVTRTLAEWAIETGITEDALHLRITRYGWAVERALTQPLRITKSSKPA